MKNDAFVIRDDTILFPFLADRFRKLFKPYERVAVKLHMGEPGNPNFIPPSFARRVVAAIAEIGCNPFLFDSPVIYESPRGTVEGYLASAAAHGYTKESVGAPIVVSNRSVAVPGRRMTFHCSADPIEADGVLLLSHFKGHIASGMGGAIKNVGMGCMARETKGDIHCGGEPLYRSGCTQCGDCVAQCPTDNIRIVADRPEFGATWCPGCSNCVLVCPQQCIAPRVDVFDQLLAEAAVLAHGRFRKRYAINVLKRIAQYCDCVADAGPMLVDDIGYVCAEDMLTADAGSLELVKRAAGVKDLFAERNKRSPWGHVLAAATLMGRSIDVSVREL